MSTQITNYQCPSCTGPLHYVGASDKLECEYCGSSYDVAEIEVLYAEKEEKAAETQQAEEQKKQAEASSAGDEWDTSDLQQWDAEEDDMQAYSCPSCGAELICDKTTAATSCPYCGNPTVVPGQFSGSLKPDYIIPFKLSKEEAIQKLKEHYKGKIFLPKDFKEKNHIEEIRRIYVPFWMFDGKAEGDALYAATRSHSYRSGDYEITETEHYDVYRAGVVNFEKVPVDASSKMPDDHMDSIEPFDYEGLKEFSTAYLPGFLADKFDVSVEESVDRADARCEGTLSSALRSTVKNYDTCTLKSNTINLQRGKVHYAMLPVWMLNTKWKGRDFLFAMNGQTGKMVGDLPVSRGKFWGLFAAIAIPLSIVGSIVLLSL
ncbi:hypothetical protein [Anaerotignum sp.]|uniref:hypothetical protein n=1 Tax=Anaerotignum sp. TaxID=2039241 RepID=UPI003734C4D4